MSTQSLRCSACSAPFTAEVAPDALTVKCSFCGTVNELTSRVAPRPVEARGKSTTAGPVIALAALLGVVGVIVAVVISSRAARPLVVVQVPTSVPPTFVPPVVPTTPKLDVPMGPQNLYWLDQYIAPVGVDANGDGIEDLAGAFIIHEREALNAYLGVIDGKTLEPLWKDGPFGTRAKATRAMGVAVRAKAGRLVGVTALGDGAVYDLKTGEKLSTFDFDVEDAARWICAPDDDGPVYLGTHQGGELLDVRTLERRRAAQPRACEAGRRRWDTGDVGERRAHHETRAAPKLERFEVRAALNDGSDGVLIGAMRGSDLATLVGFDPATKAERWRKPITEFVASAVGRQVTAVELVGGRFYFTCAGDDRGQRLLAIDATTGATVWDTFSPGGELQNVSISATRLMAVTLEWDSMPVNVFDLETGKLLARLGGHASRF